MIWYREAIYCHSSCRFTRPLEILLYMMHCQRCDLGDRKFGLHNYAFGVSAQLG